jgi:guanylate kinase
VTRGAAARRPGSRTVPASDPRRLTGGPERQAFPVILSAPSGAGKTSVARAVLARFPELAFAVSFTTRAPRGGEVAGRDYEFVSEEEFLALADAGTFVEWARVHGQYYGTPRTAIEEPLAAGRHVLLDVDVQGAKALLAEYPFAVSLFLLPPTLEVMAARLRGRGTEGEEALRIRLANAVREIPQAKHYQYVLVNEELEETIDLFEHVLRAEEQRRSRITNWKSWIEAAFGPAARGGKRA